MKLVDCFTIKRTFHRFTGGKNRMFFDLKCDACGVSRIVRFDRSYKYKCQECDGVKVVR